jgi:hypothetical protein
VFPARYELNSYIVFRKRLVSKRLSHITSPLHHVPAVRNILDGFVQLCKCALSHVFFIPLTFHVTQIAVAARYSQDSIFNLSNTEIMGSRYSD